MTTIAVIICMHTEDRWDDIEAAVRSIEGQTRRPDELILLVDHNPALLERARQTFGGVARVIENVEERGESGARNSSAKASRSDVLAYLDDDAVADPRWIETLLARYDDPDVVGVGGTARPAWDGGRPGWFPSEFNWVVGCSHSGIPDEPAPVRNFIGCNMSFRRTAWERVGGFDSRVGRVGANAQGCSETEFCIRVADTVGGTILNEPAAAIAHRVPAARSTLRYFVKRCRNEGISKARLAELRGPESALSSERDYLRRTLPRGVVAGLRDGTGGDRWGLARSGAIVLGTAATGAGYVEGRLRALVTR